MRKKYRIFHLVHWQTVHAWADLGWYWDGTFRGSPYPDSLLVEWICDCPIVTPKKDGETRVIFVEIPVADARVPSPDAERRGAV